MTSVEIRREGAFCYLTINRPHKKNALDTEVCLEDKSVFWRSIFTISCVRRG